jgi:hypothetical protein
MGEVMNRVSANPMTWLQEAPWPGLSVEGSEPLMVSFTAKSRTRYFLAQEPLLSAHFLGMLGFYRLETSCALLASAMLICVPSPWRRIASGVAGAETRRLIVAPGKTLWTIWGHGGSMAEGLSS